MYVRMYVCMYVRMYTESITDCNTGKFMPLVSLHRVKAFLYPNFSVSFWPDLGLGFSLSSVVNKSKS